MIFGNFVRKISWIFFKYICQGKVHCLENLTKLSTPYIVAVNHVSYLDWLILYGLFTVVIKKKICFLAKKRLFFNPLWKKLMDYSNSIYIDQENISVSSIKEIKQRFENGFIIGIFPEGKRSESGKLLQGQGGFAKISLFLDSPVIPIGLNGFYEALPKNRKIPRISKMNINVGNIIEANKSKKNIDIDFFIKNVMNEIARLTNQEYKF